MTERPNDTWFLIRNFPAIARAGVQLVTDDPKLPKLRIDPEGAKKREARVRFRRPFHIGEPEAAPPDPVPKPSPRTRRIYLQWLDERREPAWRDTDIEIDIDKPSVRNIEGWLLGRQHHGSGAIGVFIFASPALFVLSPYLAAKVALWRSRERREGMSRHGIALLERLRGQIDPDAEALLREALKNDWTHHRKMTRRVTFEEARDLLTECELNVRRYGEPGTFPRGEARLWMDADGDLVARAEIGDESPNPPTIEVLGSSFKDGNARILLEVCLRRNDEDESPET